MGSYKGLCRGYIAPIMQKQMENKRTMKWKLVVYRGYAGLL